MSLDVYLYEVSEHGVFDYNITHNLNGMASLAGLYEALWRPEEIGVKTARELVPILTDGLALLKADPEQFKGLNPTNGWGDYDGLVRFVENYLAACVKHPSARVEVSR